MRKQFIKKQKVIAIFYFLLLLGSMMPLFMEPTNIARAATTIYVATDGDDDTGDGGIGNPYLTIQKAVDEATNGDTIYVRVGTYTPSTQIVIDGFDGLTVSGYQAETVIINGTNCPLGSGTYDYLNAVIEISDSTNIRITNLIVEWSARGGITIGPGSSSDACSHVCVDNCTIRNCSSFGFKSGSTNHNITFEYNTVEHCHNQWNSEAISQEAVSFSNTADFIIRYNNVLNNHCEGIDAKSGCTRGAVYGNIINTTGPYTVTKGGQSMCGGPGIYIDGYSSVVSHVDVYNNFITGNFSAMNFGAEETGGIIHNISIYNNVINIYGTGSRSVYFGHSSPSTHMYDVEFVHNTVYQSGDPGNSAIVIQNTKDYFHRCTMKNNIFAIADGTTNYAYVVYFGGIALEDDLTGHLAFDYNCYWRYPGTYCTVRICWTVGGSTSGGGENSIKLDPVFIDRVGHDFYLNDSSPCIDVGDTCGVVFDYSGFLRPAGMGYDIGAYEHNYISPVVYAGGTSTRALYAYRTHDMSFLYAAEPYAYGSEIQAIASDDDYVYVSSGAGEIVYQYWKGNFTLRAQTPSYGGTIYGIAAQNDTYLYAAGGTVFRIKQYYKSNMTYKAQSDNYGAHLYALAEDDLYLYAGGAGNTKVYQYWKSNLTKKAETVSYGGYVKSIAVDGLYIYVGGATTNKINQYYKSNLTYKGQSVSYGANIQAMVLDDTYIYIAGTGVYKVFQFYKNNLTKKAETASYGSVIYALHLPLSFPSVLSMITNPATNVEETTATFHGETFYTDPLEGACITARFEYGVTTAYGTNTTNQTLSGVINEYNDSITGLTQGQLYHFRAYANDSVLAATGENQYFLTKPEAPTDLTLAVINATHVNLSWDAGIGSNRTVVVIKADSSPSNPTDGTVIYNASGTSQILDIAEMGSVYLKAWGLAFWVPEAEVNLTQWSDEGTTTALGIIRIGAWNESNPSQAANPFTVFITNQEGTETYRATGCTNYHYINASDCPLGPVQIIINCTGYNQRVYSTTISIESMFNLDAYLSRESTPPVNTSYLYYLNVYETIYYDNYQANVPVADVNLIIKRYMISTGSFETVASLMTDSTGTANIHLIPGTYYKVYLNKTGFVDSTSDFIPAPPNEWGQTELKSFRIIRIGEATPGEPPGVETRWTNITWSIEPQVFYHNTSFTVYFNITSSDNKLEWYTASLYYYNSTDVIWERLETENKTDPGGGSINVTIPNITGKYSFECAFKKQNYSVYHFGAFDGCRFYFISLSPLEDIAEGIPDAIYLFVMVFLIIAAIAFLVKFGAGAMSGIGGLCVMGFMLALKPNLMIGSPGVSAWWMFAATCVTYLIVLFIYRGRT